MKGMSSSRLIRRVAGTDVDAEVVEPNIVAPPPPEWLPARPGRARRAPQRHWTARIVEATVMVSVLVWAALLAGGVDGPQALRLTVVIGVQTVGGALLWRLVRGTTGPHLSELAGMGLGLGTLLSLLAQQALRVTSLDRQAWWLPTAAAGLLVVVLALVPAGRARLRLGVDARLGLDEVAPVALGLAVGLAFLETFWRAHPLHWTGWWAYYSDIPYHEALATSVTTWGPGDNILAVGSPIRYHWFSDAWAGTTTAAAGAGPFVVITRLLPVVALLGTVLLVWAWARRLSAISSVPLLAVVLTTMAMSIGTFQTFDFMHDLTLSPSLALAAPWLLGAALVFTEFLTGRLGWVALLPLALLAVGTVGGKTSDAAALLGGVGLASIASLVRSGRRRRVLAAGAVVLVAAGAAFVVLILGSAGNLTVQAGATAKVLNVLPNSSVLGVVVGTLGAVLVLATSWTGLAVLTAQPSTRGRPEVWFGLGAALTGIALMSGLGHPGASQIYFPMSAGLLVVVLSAWGLGEAARQMSWGTAAAAVASGITAGVVSHILGTAVGQAARAAAKAKATDSVSGLSTAGSANPEHGLLSEGLTWIAPYAVWALPVLVAVGVAVGVRVRVARLPRGGLVGVLAVGVVTASLVVGAVGLEGTVRAHRPKAPEADAALAWSAGQRAPLLWLRQHSAVDDIVATNRQCNAVEHPGDECDGPQRWFLTAALTGRRMYVEGADYAVAQPHPLWVDERVDLSRRFVDEPTAADAVNLWNAGVRWVVVDLASTYTRTWAPYGEPVVTSPTTVVLRLERP